MRFVTIKISFFILVVMLLINCKKEDKSSNHFYIKDTVEYIHGIDCDSIKYFNGPKSIDFQANKFIISDTDNHRVVVCDTTFKILNIFGGQAGQGPNDLVLPVFSTLKNGKLYVNDPGQGCIKCFDYETKEFLNKITFIGDITAHFAVKNNGNIVAGNGAPDSALLVEYAMTGELIQKFGNRDIDNKEQKLFITKNWCNTYIDNNGYIYALFTEGGILHKYSNKGKLIWKKDVSKSSNNVLEAIEYNNKWEKKNPSHSHQIRIILADMKVDKSKIYIRTRSKVKGRQTLYEFICLDSKSGNYLYTYNDPEVKFTCRDFAIYNNQIYMADVIQSQIFITGNILRSL